MKKARIIVGMSGGVDSSVTALLLKQQGHDVQGVYMKNWDDNAEQHCPQDQDLSDAKHVCETLDIPFSTVNFQNDYWNRVFQYFLDEYASGRTPNPDVLCNKEIKFKAFLHFALDQGAEYIATGHYARIKKSGKNFQLLTGKDANKDQSYFLHQLDQTQLAHALFPLGELNKSEVRAMASAAGFANHAKKDSTGICFIGERKFKAFLGEYLLAQPGPIETTGGQVIAQHDGLMFYTLGQRQGLGIGGVKNAPEAPWYVVDKDIERKALIVAQGREHPALFANTLRFDQLHWISGANLEQGTTLRCEAKTRYRQPAEACHVTFASKGHGQVHFDRPQWAITPGQSVVFYQGEQCLGGGVILGST